MSHNAWVEKLASGLRAAGLTVSLDVWDVRLGDSLTSYMTSKITEADVVLFIITEESVAAVEATETAGGAVKFELQLATARRTAGEALRVVGIYRSGQATPAHLRDYLYADFRNDDCYVASLRRLVEDLTKTRASEWVPPHIQLLIDQLHREKEDGWAEVPSNAARQLGQLGHAQAVPHLFEEIDPDFIPTPMDEHWHEVYWFWDERADDPLNQKPVYFYNDVFDALIQLGAAAVPFLVSRLRDKSATSRLKAVKLLGWIQDRSAVEPLLEVTHADSEADVMRKAYYSLAKLGDPRGVRILLHAMTMDDEEDHACWALSENAFATMDALIDALGDAENTIRERTVVALVHCSMVAIPRLILARRSRNRLIRIGAAKALSTIVEKDIADYAALDQSDGAQWQVLLCAGAERLASVSPREHHYQRLIELWSSDLRKLARSRCGECSKVAERIVSNTLTRRSKRRPKAGFA